MMTDNNWYRTIFVGTLVQESALSVGGNEGRSGVVDDPLCRDGRDRPTLRGSTLAGALIATARKMHDEIPDCITSDSAQENTSKALRPSLWRVFTSHPEAHEAGGGEELDRSEMRQGVGIRQATCASATGALFDMETLPRGTRWEFRIEVKHPLDNADEGKEAERIAAAALLEWTRGRCWIGRSVARGLGWMRLDNLRAYRLSTEHIDIWPNSRNPLSENIRSLHEVAQQISPNQFENAFSLEENMREKDDRWHYLEVKGAIEPGFHDDGYGLDAISVGGHASNLAAAEWQENYLSSISRANKKLKDDFAPDFAIVMTRNLNGDLEPFIPGSGIRGPLRHALSRHLRMVGEKVHDPTVKQKPKEKGPRDKVEELFGNCSQSASLLVSDAYLEDSEWTAAWLQHHAEDEFSGGAFETSKFDRVALLQGRFAFKIVIEANSKKQADKMFNRLNTMWNTMWNTIFPLGHSSHLPIGGGKWRGVGWPKWTFSDPRLCAAGEETWQPIS